MWAYRADWSNLGLQILKIFEIKALEFCSIISVEHPNWRLCPNSMGNYWRMSECWVNIIAIRTQVIPEQWCIVLLPAPCDNVIVYLKDIMGGGGCPICSNISKYINILYYIPSQVRLTSSNYKNHCSLISRLLSILYVYGVHGRCANSFAKRTSSWKSWCLLNILNTVIVDI